MQSRELTAAPLLPRERSVGWAWTGLCWVWGWDELVRDGCCWAVPSDGGHLQHPPVKSKDPCGSRGLVCPEGVPSRGSLFSLVFFRSHWTAGMPLSPGCGGSQALPREGLIPKAGPGGSGEPLCTAHHLVLRRLCTHRHVPCTPPSFFTRGQWRPSGSLLCSQQHKMILDLYFPGLLTPCPCRCGLSRAG